MRNIANAPHALFSAPPFVGHLGPLLPQADELVRRNWRVSVVSFEEARPFVARHPGIAFLSLGPTGVDHRHVSRMIDLITFEPSFVRGMWRILSGLAAHWTEDYDHVLDVLRRETPDVVIADLSHTAAISAADMRRPSATVTTSPVKLSRHSIQLDITVEIIPGTMLRPTENVPT
jgi:UDP:flavonoid glycosyltransferase YjiC (YdhE family)